MPIISVRDNEKNRWNRIAKKTKTNKEKNKETKAMVKRWELNDFAVHLS